MSYFYGSLFRSDERAHNLSILAIDYDSSDIGSALQAAYNQLKGSDFLTLQHRPTSEFPDISSLGQSAICSQGYWGVIYTHPGATERLRAAIPGKTPYNSSETITIINNGIKYPVISQTFVEARLAALTSATTSIFHATNGRELCRAINSSSPTALSAMLESIRTTTIVLSPATQGTRVLLNTITMVVPPLTQFFFVMALDHISIALGVYSRWRTRSVYLSRLAGSKLFSFTGALIVAVFIFAFKENWDLTGVQFVEIWLCFWFYMTISYLVMDSLIGTIVPMRFAPFCIFTWVIVNVTSTLNPFDLSSGFYRWGYALPAHNTWLLLMQIWSRGCDSKLHVALPVLFVWWIVGHCTSAYAIWKKCTTTPTSEPANHVSKVSESHDKKPIDHKACEEGEVTSVTDQTTQGGADEGEMRKDIVQSTPVVVEEE